jgi:hypothetical protein
MKQTLPPHRRALAALVPTLALLAVPAVAQETQTTVAPPPVVQTTPVQAAPAPAPVPAPVQSAPVQTVQTEPVEAPPPPEAVAPRATPARQAAPRATPPRAASQSRVTQAPVARPNAAPVAALPDPVSAPVAATPQTTTPVTTPVPAEQTSASTTTETSTATPATEASKPGFWSSPWLALLGVGLIALVGLLWAARRRRAAEYDSYDEPVTYEEPVYKPVATPVMAEPVVAPVVSPSIATEAAPAAIMRGEPQFLRRAARVQPEPVAPAVDDSASAAAVAGTGELVAADAGDVAALTAGDAPVADRPWLEMAMRPLRAGTNVAEAVVEIELTIGNSGSVSANDVRISTFMFAGAPADNEMDRLLLEREGEVSAVRIAPGEGRTLEATLAMPRASLNGSVSPVIVADARYSLPDGSEGRTSASFRIGVSDDGGDVTPIPIGRPHMHDEVTAELFGVPEHA